MYNLLNGIMGNPVVQAVVTGYNSLPHWKDWKKYLPASEKVKAFALIILVASARAVEGVNAVASLNNRVTPLTEDDIDGIIPYFLTHSPNEITYLPYSKIFDIDNVIQLNEARASIALTNLPHELQSKLQTTLLPPEYETPSCIYLVRENYSELSRLYYKYGFSRKYLQEEKRIVTQLTNILSENNFTYSEIKIIFKHLKNMQRNDLLLEEISQIACTHNDNLVANKIIVLIFEYYISYLTDLGLKIPEHIRNKNWQYLLNNNDDLLSLQNAIFNLFKIKNSEEIRIGNKHHICQEFNLRYKELFQSIQFASKTLNDIENSIAGALPLTTYIHTNYRQLKNFITIVHCFADYFKQRGENVEKITQLEKSLHILQLDFFITSLKGCLSGYITNDFFLELVKARKMLDTLVRSDLNHLVHRFVKLNKRSDASQFKKELSIDEIDISIQFANLPFSLQSKLQTTDAIYFTGKTYLELCKLYYQEGLSQNYKQKEKKKTNELTLTLYKKGFKSDEIKEIFQNMKITYSKGQFLERMSGAICHHSQPTLNELIIFILEEYFSYLEEDLRLRIPEELRNINNWKPKLNNFDSSFYEAIFELIQIEKKYFHELSSELKTRICKDFFSTYNLIFNDISSTISQLDAFIRLLSDDLSPNSYIQSVFGQLQKIKGSIQCFAQHFQEKDPEKLNKIIQLEQDLINLQFDFFIKVMNGCSKQSNGESLPPDFLEKLDEVRVEIDDLAIPTLEELVTEFRRYSVEKLKQSDREEFKFAGFLSIQLTIFLLGCGTLALALCTKKNKAAIEATKKLALKAVSSKTKAKKKSAKKPEKPKSAFNAEQTNIIFVDDDRMREEIVEKTVFRIPTEAEDAVLGSESKYKKPLIPYNRKKLLKKERQIKKQTTNVSSSTKKSQKYIYQNVFFDSSVITPETSVITTNTVSSSSSQDERPFEGKEDTRHLQMACIQLTKPTPNDTIELGKKKIATVTFEIEKDRELMTQRLEIAYLAASNIETIHDKYLLNKSEVTHLDNKQEIVHLALLYNFLRLFESLNSPDLSPNGREFIGKKLFDLKDSALYRHEIRHRGYTIKPDDCFKFAGHFCSLKISKRINAQETGFLNKIAANINYKLLKSSFNSKENNNINVQKYLDLTKKIAKKINKSQEADDPKGISLAAVKMCLIILRECLPFEEEVKNQRAKDLIDLTNSIVHSMEKIEDKKAIEMALQIDELSVSLTSNGSNESSQKI